MNKEEGIIVRPVEGKSQLDLANEWDRIADVRQEQISSGKDLSFRHVLLPSILNLIRECDLRRALDVGCGTGDLAKDLSELCDSVTGTDGSAFSIKVARENCAKLPNVSFFVGDVEELATEHPRSQYTVVVANMTLMACLNLKSLVEATASLLVSGGYMISTITHPWFWPHYKGYANAEWFDYNQELVLEAPFSISAEQTEFVTTHVHRPMLSYINTLSYAGFLIDRILEPYPNDDIHALYPKPWRFPRFLAMRAKLIT